ncbi:hypothetical protein EDD11_009819 [Mortierella claussenii]|nr:hypothetical protein EDD11_009819 [Mortierella claussenii]
MRLATLYLGLGALLSVSVTVLAQEIIAQEEWFESMKLSRGLVTRRLHSNRHRVRQQLHHHSHRASSNNPVVDHTQESEEVSPVRLQKRVEGFPLLSEIEQRASAFKSFQEDATKNTPAIMHVDNKAEDRGEDTKENAAMEGVNLHRKVAKRSGLKVKDGAGRKKHEMSYFWKSGKKVLSAWKKLKKASPHRARKAQKSNY